MMIKVKQCSIWLLPLLLAACQREAEPALRSEGAEDVKLSVSTDVSDTKTWLDSGVEGTTFPVYWSDGDKICVNGKNSDALSVAPGVKTSHADFTFRGLAQPYRVIYPAEACGNFNEDGTVLCVLPAVQVYRQESFADGAALMYASSDHLTVQLKHACGVLRFTLSSTEAIRISSVWVESPNASLSGRFLLDPASGVLTAQEGDSRLSLELAQAVEIEAGASRDFWFAVPAGAYPDGFRFHFVTEDGQVKNSSWMRASAEAEKGVVVRAGEAVRFQAAFAADQWVIVSASQWKTLAEAINAGEDSWKEKYLKDGVISLGADITLSGSDDVAITSFPYILDGNGFTFTRPSASGPLVSTLKGTLRRLNLSGSYSGKITPVVGVLDGGALEYVTSNFDFSAIISDKDVVVAGLVQTAREGRIDHCRNTGSMTIKAKVTASGNYRSIAAGLVAVVNGDGREISLADCTNAAEVNVSLSQYNSTNANTHVACGGLVGYVAAGNVTLSSCKNAADLTLAHVKTTAVPSRQASLGGLVGLCAPLSTDGTVIDPAGATAVLTVSDGVNTGKLNNTVLTAVASNIWTAHPTIGGIVGSLMGSEAVHSVVERCTNFGDILPYEAATNPYSRADFGCICGGLVGLAGYADLRECSVVDVSVGSRITPSYISGGAIGCPVRTFTLKNSSVVVRMNVIPVSTYTDKSYGIGCGFPQKVPASGLILDDSEISSCLFGGSLWRAKPVSHGQFGNIELDVMKTYTDDASIKDDILATAGLDGAITLSDNHIKPQL